MTAWKKPATVLAVLVVTLQAAAAGAHAAQTRAEEVRAEREIARLTSALGQVGATTLGPRVVSLNGASIGFDTKTEDRPLEDVVKAVAKECESGVASVALPGAVKPRGDAPGLRDIELQRIVTQTSEGGDVIASLCIFAPEQVASGAQPDATPRVRYTLAHRVDATTTRVTTIANGSSADLAALFPAEGDAPGSDLAGVPRPASGRRTLTAVVGEREHEVRVYESPLGLAEAVQGYDGQMAAAGWATTGHLADARMYRKDGRSVAVSFQATTDGSSVTVAPFDDEREAR